MIDNLNNISNTIVEELPHLKNFQWLPSRTYTLEISHNQFNETSTKIINILVKTENVPDGTILYLNIDSSSTATTDDFETKADSITIDNNSGSISWTLKEDFTTEGNETLKINLLIDSTNGTVVASSDVITINDTSVNSTILSYSQNIPNTFNPTPTFIFTSTKTGKISCNYGFSTTTEAVIGENKITFNSLRQRDAAYNDITIKLVDENDSVISNILTIPSFKVLPHKIVLDDETVLIGGEYINGELNATVIMVSTNQVTREGNTFQHGDLVTAGVYDWDYNNGAGSLVPYANLGDAVFYRIDGDITNPNNYNQFNASNQRNMFNDDSSDDFSYHVLTEADIGKRIAIKYIWSDGTAGLGTQTVMTFPTVIISDNTELQLNTSGFAFSFNNRSDTNPTLVFRKGSTYNITLNNSGHPFAIYKDENRTEKYNDGLKWINESVELTGENAQEKTTGILQFTVPIDAPDKLYYKCTLHSNMKGEITIVGTNLKIYYTNELFEDTVNESSIILNSLFKQYKMDYNILVDYFNMGNNNTLAYASMWTQSFSVNSYYFEEIISGSVPEGQLLGHINDICVTQATSTFVHEVMHIFEGIGLDFGATNDFTNSAETEYTGGAALTGYKTLLKENITKINNERPSGLPIFDEAYITNNIVMIPMEDSGGSGSKGAHWDEGKWSDGNGNDKDTPGRVKDGIYYPLLINEIMSSASDYGPNKSQLGCMAKPDSRGGPRTIAYITPMTIGALTDNGHIMNTESSWIVTNGLRMEWELPNDLNDN